jgi:hypothetical protein
VADTEAEIRQRKVRVKDGDGNLVEAGYWWFEPIEPTFFSTDAVTRGLWAGGPAFLFLWWATGQPIFALGLLACVAGLVVRYWYGRHFLQRYKEVLFCADGRLYIAPNLAPSEKRELALHQERHHDIVSFEVEQYQTKHNTTRYSVNVYFRSGNVGTVTMFHQYEQHARVVAVQLTLALQELREAGRVSTRSQTPASANPPTPTARPRRVIE